MIFGRSKKYNSQEHLLQYPEQEGTWACWSCVWLMFPSSHLVSLVLSAEPTVSSACHVSLTQMSFLPWVTARHQPQSATKFQDGAKENHHWSTSEGKAYSSSSLPCMGGQRPTLFPLPESRMDFAPPEPATCLSSSPCLLPHTP